MYSQGPFDHVSKRCVAPLITFLRGAGVHSSIPVLSQSIMCIYIHVYVSKYVLIYIHVYIYIYIAASYLCDRKEVGDGEVPRFFAECCIRGPGGS